MNHTAVEDLFLREEEIPVAVPESGASVTSDVRDWKKWGRDPTKDLTISVWVHNAASLTAGATTLSLLTCATNSTTESDWTSVATAAGAVSDIDKNGRLMQVELPRKGLKEFVKVTLTNTTAFNVKPVLSVGLDNDAEFDIDSTMVSDKVTKPGA